MFSYENNFTVKSFKCYDVLKPNTQKKEKEIESPLYKRGSRGAARAAKSLRWSI